MARHTLGNDLHLANIPLDLPIIRTTAGRALSIGTTEPTENLMPGGLWLDTENALVKYNSGTLDVPVLSAFTASTGLAKSIAIEGGTYDLTLFTTTQTTKAATLTIPDLGGTAQDICVTAAAQTLTNKTLTAPAITGGTAIELTTFSLRDSVAAYDLIIASTSTGLSADKTLTIDCNNSNATLDLNGNVAFGGTFAATGNVSVTALTLAGAWTQTGAHAVGITTGAATTLVFPAGGANFEVVAALNTSFATGDILQYNAAGAWEILAVGSNGETITTDGTTVSWGSVTSANASNLLDGCTLQDTGALDCELAFTEQTVSAPTLTVPDYAGADQTLATLNLAQTWLQAQTFKYGKFLINDSNDTHAMTINWEENDTVARALDIKVNAGNRIIDLSGNLVLAGTFTTTGAWTQTGAHTVGITTTGATTITLPTAGTLVVSGGALGAADIVGGTATELTSLSIRDSVAAFDLIIVSTNTGFAAADKTLTIDTNNANATLELTGNVNFGGTFVSTGAVAMTSLTLLGAWAQTGAHSVDITTTAATAITLPISGTLVAKDSTDALTNKTLDCLGTGNVVTNVNADELDPTTLGATSAYAVPFLITKVLTDLPDTGTDIYADACPFKLKIMDAWALSTTAHGGTWAVHKGKVGALGNAFVEAVTVAATDKIITRAASCDDDYQEIASGGSIVAVGDGGDALDIKLTLLCIRSD